MSGSEVYVHQVVENVGRGSSRYIAVVVNSDGHPRAWCGHSHRSRQTAEKCGGWAAEQHRHDNESAALGALAQQPDEDPIDHARRVSAHDLGWEMDGAHDLGWEMDGEEPDDA